MAQVLDPTAAGRNLLALPDEIISQIFRLLAPEDNLLNLQRACKRINHLANGPWLWRHHCLSQFSYWHPKHGIKKRVARPIGETDWKELYRVRATCNRKIAADFSAIVAESSQRFARIQDIARLGYDAKDFLLRHCRADPLSGDGLARRFHSNVILGSIHRDLAITEWLFTARGLVPAEDLTPAHRLERAIGAFDLFVLHDQPGDLDQISSMLDRIASDFREAHPRHNRMTTREKALALLRWLQSSNLVGLREKEKIGDLRNCLLGHALRDEKHGSNPAISSIIFCSVARRVGLDAHCCELPMQLHAIVRPPQGLTLDDWPIDPEQPGKSQSRLILLPFGQDVPVSENFLRSLLPRIGWDNIPLSRLLNPLSSAQLAFKAAVNLDLIATKLSNSLVSQQPGTRARLLCGNDHVNLKACQYAALWAELAMTNHKTDVWKQALARLIEQLMQFWPEDTWLVEKHLSALHQEADPLSSALTLQKLRTFIGGHPRHPYASLGSVSTFWTIDDDNTRVHIPFRIGQVFRHKRQNWYGVITAWYDLGVISMPEYNKDGVLVYRALRPPIDPTLSNRYLFRCLTSSQLDPWIVRPQNMELVTDSSLVTADMFPAAGNFFLRFDKATCTFVSNVQEQMHLVIPPTP